MHVVAAALLRDGECLIQQRLPGKHMAGFWEFPGGKVELGEQAWDALARELAEELNIHIEAGEPLIQLTHEYPEYTVHLDVWSVTQWSGVAVSAEGQNIKWLNIDALRHESMLPADAPVLRELEQMFSDDASSS